MALLTKIGGTGWAAGGRVFGVAFAAPFALFLAMSLAAPGALAEIINQSDACTIDLGTGDCEAGTDPIFTINFDGSIEESDPITGLTAMLEVTFVGAYSATDASTDPVNLWVFQATLTNTTDPILFQDSRVSAFGFNVGGFCVEWDEHLTQQEIDDGTNDVSNDTCVDTNWDDQLIGVGATNEDWETRVLTNADNNQFAPFIVNDDAPLFTDDNEGSFPNMFGNIDVCFVVNPNNCSGGGSGGISLNDDPNYGTLTFVLAFSGALVDNPSIELSNFGVRYQSIWSTFYGFEDDSGTGRRIPEPGTLTIMMLGLVGIGWSRNRRRRKIAA